MNTNRNPKPETDTRTESGANYKCTVFPEDVINDIKFYES